MADKITVRQASREADVTSQRIIVLIKEGVLQAEKLGFQYVIDRASFDAWLIKTGRKQAQEGGEAEAGARAEA